MELSVIHTTVTLLLFLNFVVGFVSKRSYNISREHSSRIIFPGMETEFETENEIQEIPLHLIRQLNEVSSVEEFLRTMVVHTDPESMDISDRIGSDDVERHAVKSAKNAKCIPELKSVPLMSEKIPGIVYYPPCTRVQRCGGCCLHDLFSCQPTETEIIPMSVVVSEYRGGNQLRYKETKIVEVEQHLKCQCDCKVRPENCTKYQKYSPDKCRCECKNTDKERKCYDEGSKKLWNPETCSCECRNELECGSGFEFDPFTCNCIAARGRKKTLLYQIFK